MVEVKNGEVFNLERAQRAIENSFNVGEINTTEGPIKEKLAKSLGGNMDPHQSHDAWLKGILVTFDIKHNGVFMPEFQRYHFADIVTSSSKMHRLVKMDLNRASNKYVSKDVIDYVNSYIELYNHLLEEKEQNSFIGHRFTLRDGTVIECDNVEDALYTCYMIIISNCPMGLELFMRVSTNYKQLQTIYFQRKHHKLHEWGNFCKMIEGLPYFKELILGEDTNTEFKSEIKTDE